MTDNPSKPVPGGKSAAENKKTRITYVIDNPFCQIQWPTIDSKTEHDLILELLCTLLSPIGDHRRTYIDPTSSKGKRSKKQARAARKKARLESNGGEGEEASDQMEVDSHGTTSAKVNLSPASTSSISQPQPVKGKGKDVDPSQSLPPAPEVSSHVLIGLNSITSALNTTIATQLPSTFSSHLSLHPPKKRKRKANSATSATLTPTSTPYLTAIFLTRSDSQPTPLHAHLPMLTYLSSIPSHPHHTLLVPLPKGSAAKLQQALGIPSANFIGLWDTLPETGTGGKLLEVVRRVVQPVRVPWLERKLPIRGEIESEREKEEEEEKEREGPKGLKEGEYQPLRVKVLRTMVGPSKKGNGQKKVEDR